MRSRGMDLGTSMGLQATAVGVGAAALIYSAHSAGIERMHQAREDREQAARNAAVADLGQSARLMASELAAAHAEIAKLKRALAQRQAYIDSIRRAA